MADYGWDLLKNMAERYPSLWGIIILAGLGWLAYKAIMNKLDALDEKAEINYNEQLAQEEAMKKLYINGQTDRYEEYKRKFLEDLEDRRIKLKPKKRDKK